MLTSPACAQTSTGPATSGSRSARSLPWSSAGTTCTRVRPSPTSPSDLANVECARSPITTGSGGAPNSPSACTSQPIRASSASRAAARQAALATVAPVTNASPVSAGSRSRSTSHPRTTWCSRAATGDITGSAAFWSHAAASQALPIATGYVAPVTNPK